MVSLAPKTVAKCLGVICVLTFVQWVVADRAVIFGGAYPRNLRSAIEYKEDRFSAEFTNVSTQALISDLLAYDGSKWKVEGNLTGFITIQLHQMNLEQCIRKIMRNQRWNYTLVLSPPGPEGRQRFHISELTIYQAAATVRFSKLSPDSAPHLPQAASAAPAVDFPTKEARPFSAPLNVTPDKKAVDREIKSFMDQLLEEKKISRQEYDRAVMEMEGLKNQ